MPTITTNHCTWSIFRKKNFIYMIMMLLADDSSEAISLPSCLKVWLQVFVSIILSWILNFYLRLKTILG